MKNMPYFDYLLAALEKGNHAVEESFGLHVHWGYWQQPKQAKQTQKDFATATETLSQLVYNAAHIKNGQTVLDVGCGFGGTIASINQNFQAMDLVGLNIDERQIIRARHQVKPIGNNKIVFQQGDACALPFPDNSFDVVLAVECIFHFPSREQFFKEVFRVLKPGGHLAISDFLLRKSLKFFHNLSISQYLTNGFFGSCNVQFTGQEYRKLGEMTNMPMELAQNITKNTLPTYTYLKSLIKNSELAKSYPIKKYGVIFTVACIESLSWVSALEYYVFSFKKEQPT